MRGLSTALRGYGTAHQRLRKAWKPKVDRGEVHCARCGGWIEPGTPWDLGHHDEDRRVYTGPEHIKCNRGAPALIRAARKAQVRPFSRSW